MIYKFLSRVIFSLAVATNVTQLACAADQVAPAPQQRITNVIWTTGTSVSYCDSARGPQGGCYQASMPDSVGYVEKIIQADFISPNRISWIVLATERISICAVKNNGEVLCIGVANDTNHQNYDITYRDGVLYVMPSESARQSSVERTMGFTSNLFSAVNSASIRLEKAMAAESNPLAKTQSSTKVSGRGMSSMSRGEDRGGNSDAVDMPELPDGPGLGGAGGYNGGQVKCVGVVCIITYPRPPGIAFEDLPITGVSPSVPLCVRLGLCSTSEDDERFKRDELARCAEAKARCRKECSDMQLGTPPGNDGWNFVKCVNKCMDLTGCQ